MTTTVARAVGNSPLAAGLRPRVSLARSLLTLPEKAVLAATTVLKYNYLIWLFTVVPFTNRVLSCL